MSSILLEKVETKDSHRLWITAPGCPQIGAFAGVKPSSTASACGCALPCVGIGRDTSRKDTTQASRPRTNGVGAPVQGLADRKDTTDS